MKEFIKTLFLDGYATSDITVTTVLTCLLFTLAIGIYIYYVYKRINRNSFYNENFNISLIALTVIVAAIILTIQSNMVVSLGMVGALSIVRFRTAIKDPMDLIFLFWSISVGIICGAGFALIAVVASIIVTGAILVASLMPKSRGTMALVINADSYTNEKDIIKVVEEETEYCKVRAKNATKNSLNMTIEIRQKQDADVLADVLKLDYVKSASMVEHDGNITM